MGTVSAVGAGRSGRVLTRATLGAALRCATRPTRRNLLHWGSWVFALTVELTLAAVLRSGHIYGWEQALARRLQAVPGRHTVFDITSTLTNTLSIPFLVLFLVIGALVWWSGHRGAVVMLALSFPLHVLAQAPKALIDRPRPSAAFPGIDGVGGLQSFPSGHVEYVVTFYGFLTYLVIRHVPSLGMRVAIVLGWVGFSLATGFGRVALGRHWPLDVLASYVIGLGLLSGMIWLYTALRCVRSNPTEGHVASSPDHRGRTDDIM